ncbi:MAG: SGNH/GDSL hydrolase family protein [Oscillospiraceae bacterium]|nr:SGNH/GDSL hydrolase family protein [Oscillospiraceae bacterium]
MLLTNDKIQQIYFGAYSFTEEDGYLRAYQYTQAQMDYFKAASDDFWYPRTMASNSKTLEFNTAATKVSFDYKIVWVGSQDSFELMIDGVISRIVYVKDIEEEGTLSFDLPAGEKSVVIYLPADAAVLIRNVDINDSYTVPVKKEKVLWLGDSITQGYGPLRSAQTYVSVANRLLGYDILNLGIGGYVYDKNSIVPMEGYKPDKIIVALGTNQYGDKTMDAVEDYYKALTGIYGDTPILCITPLWRGDNPEGVPTLTKYCENIRKVAEKYKNVKIVDGFKLVPHLPEYFLDLLHPNCLGCEVYGRNLVEEIRRLGF